MRFSEMFNMVPAVEPANYGSAGVDFDSMTLAKAHTLAIVVIFGALTGNSVLKVSTGATAGAKTTDIAFKYRFGGGDFKAANADVLGDLVSVASTGLTLTAATFDHRMVVIEIDADSGTDGQPWATVSIDATATVLNIAAFAIGRPRNATHPMATII